MKPILFILLISLIILAMPLTVYSQEQPTIPTPPTAKSAVPVDLPEEYGLYYQAADGWHRLHLTQAAKHEQKQSGFTQWTGMTMNGASFHIKVFYAGQQAGLRVNVRPTFVARMSEASKIDNLVVYRFKEHKDKRELETVQTSAERTGGGEQRAKASAISMMTKRVGPEVFVLTPEDDLAVGEYILTGDNGSTGYDFGVSQ